MNYEYHACSNVYSLKSVGCYTFFSPNALLLTVLASPTTGIHRAAIANFNRCIVDHHRTTLLESNILLMEEMVPIAGSSIGETRVWLCSGPNVQPCTSFKPSSSLHSLDGNLKPARSTPWNWPNSDSRKTWRKVLVSSKMVKLRSLGGCLVVQFGVDYGGCFTLPVLTTWIAFTVWSEATLDMFVCCSRPGMSRVPIWFPEYPERLAI